MAPLSLVSTLILLTVATLTTAAPANHLRKRSFTLAAQGFTDPSKAIGRAHRKWGIDFDKSPAAIIANKLQVTKTITLLATSTAVATAAPYGNTTSPAPTIADADSPTTTGSGEVVASPEANEISYLSPVSIGGQTLNLDFDTGSADLWVFSTSLSSSEIGQHTAYDPTKSSTWSEYSGASWNITYGDASHALGTVGFDVVNVGGVVAPRQCVEIATDVSDQFTQDVSSDGLLGLGFSIGNTVQPQQQKTFFENVMDSLTLPLFTADLDDNAAGTYEFGAVDASKYVGEIYYTPVDPSNGYWEFESTAYAVGTTTTQCSSCSNAIADTGTSLMMMDQQVVDAYYAQAPGAKYDRSTGGYIYPCDAALPDFSVAIGTDYMATILGADMTYMSLGDGSCYGGLQYGPGSIQILGDMFLKSYFAVFDGGAQRLGVAKKSG